MAIAPGYLLCLDAIPPLIFPFQFNPDIVSDKKSFKYSPASQFGQWGFDRTRAGVGALATLAGLFNDVKEFGSLLTATKPLEPQEGEPRSIGLEFALDASIDGPEEPYRSGSRDIRFDLAILRSFMYPGWELTTLLPELFTSKTFPCWNRPPTCSLSYADISLTGVVTDLDIKMTAFNEKGEPLRAEVNLTFKEQTYSISAITDMVRRYTRVVQSYRSFEGFYTSWGEAFISPFKSFE
jgi:hypothetical protein